MEILTALLRKEHREAGLYLEEDDHLLYLMGGGKILAFWWATSVTVQEVWEEADKWTTGIIPEEKK